MIFADDYGDDECNSFAMASINKYEDEPSHQPGQQRQQQREKKSKKPKEKLI